MFTLLSFSAKKDVTLLTGTDGTISMIFNDVIAADKNGKKASWQVLVSSVTIKTADIDLTLIAGMFY